MVLSIVILLLSWTNQVRSLRKQKKPVGSGGDNVRILNKEMCIIH